MKWPEVKFANVAEIVTGNTPPKKNPDNYGPGIPWVKPPDLDAWEPIKNTAETLSPKGQKLARLLPKGTVMVCCIGSIGRVGIAGTTLATNQQINSLVFGPHVIPKYGFYYCRSIPHVFKARARKAVVPILNKSNFAKIELPLPPLSEQRRIVEILNQADALRKKRAEADAKAARILPALFYKMFGDPATNPKAWPIQPLGYVSGQNGLITDGDWILSKNMDANGSIRLIQLADIGIGTFLNRSRKYITEEKFVELKCTEVREGDLLISRMADPIGRACIVPNLQQRAITAVDVTIVRPDRKVALPEYLSALCNTEYFLHKAASSATGTTRGRITRRNLEKIEISIPPITEQMKFAVLFKGLAGNIDKQQQSSEMLEVLYRTLLHRAFTGDLTAQWREAHMKELLAEMEQQAKALETPIPEDGPATIRIKRNKRRAKG